MALDDDDQLFSFYNQELISLSQQADLPRRLKDAPPAMQAGGIFLTAHAVSPICGSEIDVDIVVTDGKVTAFGFEVEACALTKSVVAVMNRAIIGKTQSQIAAAGRELSDMLDGLNILPTGDWQALKILLPVKDYKARHNSILLPFEAVEKAFKNSP